MTSDTVIAAIDAGGTSFKCALVGADGTFLSAWRVPTGAPDETLSACASSFLTQSQARGVQPAALGIASFGPVDVDPASQTYGVITGTAKPGWNEVPIGPFLSKELGVPFHLDTDVNAALSAEMRWGAAQAARSAAYMTVGTGIGVGLFLNRDLVGRPAHPEFGHIRVARHKDDQAFPGTCDLHGDCLEGLASAKAFEARWGDPRGLSSDHPGWEIEAFYLAQACLNLYLGTRLEKIIIGGGLMQTDGLLAKVQIAFDQLLGDYLPISGKRIILSPGLGEHAGVLGGAVVALRLLS
ncbi:MAG: ROK family protein [Pseudomonadota bacterium]